MDVSGGGMSFLYYLRLGGGFGHGEGRLVIVCGGVKCGFGCLLENSREG